jgi:competence protein ComEA
MMLANSLLLIKKHWAFLIAGVVIAVIVLLSYFFNKRRVVNAGTSVKSIAVENELASSSESLYTVEVSGAVTKPGLYEVDSDSRVGDAVRLAGGLTNKASMEYQAKNINFAERIRDSEKIYIPFEWELSDGYSVAVSDLLLEKSTVAESTKSTTPSSSANTASSDDKTNVNKDTSADLDLLPGIGPAYAQKIIDNRPYANYDELVSKSKIPASTLDKLKNLISF